MENVNNEVVKNEEKVSSVKKLEGCTLIGEVLKGLKKDGKTPYEFISFRLVLPGKSKPIQISVSYDLGDVVYDCYLN